MTDKGITTGYSKNGLPFVRIDGGPKNLMIFEGLNFVHKPPSGFHLRMIKNSYESFTAQFTIYYAGRKPGIPMDYSIQNMANDYATMIENEMETPVDVMGISTGGTIAQQFAVDHPRLVRRLVLASTGYRLNENGAAVQRKLIELTWQRKWRPAAVAMVDGMMSGPINPLFKSLAWIMGKNMFGSPSDPFDGVAELEAEDKFDFKERLAEIKVPALVIGGDKDGFYPIRETGEGIPSAKLILYKNAGHMVSIKRKFNKEILAFLTEGIT